MSPCLVCPNNEQDNFSSEVLIVGYTLVLFVLYNISSFYWSIHSFPQTLALTWPTLLFTVVAPSDLRFKILNENTVQMTWRLPASRIEGFRLQVVSDTGEWPYSCRFTQAKMSALHSTYTHINNSDWNQQTAHQCLCKQKNACIASLLPNCDLCMHIHSHFSGLGSKWRWADIKDHTGIAFLNDPVT